MAKVADKKKKEEVGSMSLQELQAKLGEAKEAQFRLQFRHASHPLKNPLEIRFKRREIARLKTWIREKSKEVA